MKIILGSKSPRRREILSLMGYSFELRDSMCEEKITSTIPNAIVGDIARQKCDCIETSFDELLITSDTIVVFDGKILGKPKDEDDAYRMLAMMSGKTHTVLTAVCIKYQGTIREFVDEAHVTFKELSDEDIWSYISTGDAMDKAGSYGIQGPFNKYIASFDGSYYTIMGLPKERLEVELKKIIK